MQAVLVYLAIAVFVGARAGASSSAIPRAALLVGAVLLALALTRQGVI